MGLLDFLFGSGEQTMDNGDYMSEEEDAYTDAEAYAEEDMMNQTRMHVGMDYDSDSEEAWYDDGYAEGVPE